MRKLILVPDADGYNSTDGMETISTQLDGGQSRYRRDKIGASKMVSVKWTMNSEQYQYWRAFYATLSVSGSLAFLCDLLSEDGNGPAEHVCNFVPGSVNLPTQQGLTYVQQAQLEVKPLPRDAEYDIAIADLFEETQGQGSGVLLDLEHLVNVTAPETIGAQ